MATDGTRIFLLGGLSPDAKANKSKLIYVLDTSMYFFGHFIRTDSSLRTQNTERITYSDPHFNAVNSSEKIREVVRESSAGPSIQGQTQQPTFSLSDSDVHPEHGNSSLEEATPGELDHPDSLQTARERNRGSNDLPSLLPGMNDKPRRVPEDNNDNEGSTKHHRKLVKSYASFQKVSGTGT